MSDLQDVAAVDRRSFLQSAILLVGGSLVAVPADAIAQALTAAPSFFTAPQFALLDEICAIIIPKTSTPGAREAGVPGFIDALMKNWAAESTGEDFRAVLQKIDDQAKAQFGGGLLALPPARRIEAMRAIDAAEMRNNRSYRRLKDLVLLTYYSSEAGATQELRYELVPGSWNGSVPLKPGQPAWAA